MQTIATVMDCRIGRSGAAGVGPALGAARLACVAESGRAMRDVMTKPEVARWFEPQSADRDRLQARLAGFRALYPALRGVQAAGRWT